MSGTARAQMPGPAWACGLALALAGCATVVDLRQAGPAETFRSDRKVADVAPCLVSAWQQLSTAMAYYDVRTLPRQGGGMTVLVGNPSNSLPVLFVDLDVEPASQRTVATYYAKSSLLSDGFFKAQVQVIKQCL
jgi:hypothetical protein